MRGGEWLVYDNDFQDNVNSHFMDLAELRAACNSACQGKSTCGPDPDWLDHRCVTDESEYPLSHQIANSYFWNNLYNEVNQSPIVGLGGNSLNYIQQNRDYFVSTSKPVALSFYTPYTYPHPLRNETLPGPPAAPENLRIIQ